MVELHKLTGGCGARVFAKLESSKSWRLGKRSTGFSNDRKLQREKVGLGDNTTIIEPTSGNTGIGLAMVCAVKGYKLKIVMPESVSVERRLVLKAYGAELVLTAAKGGMREAIETAEHLAKEIGDAFIPMQFSNEANAEMHRRTTAEGDMGRYRG